MARTLLDPGPKMRDHVELRPDETQSLRPNSIDALIESIAHDFNNILVPIVALSDLLSRERLGPAETKAAIADIHRAGLRARDLVLQILALAQPSVVPARRRVETARMLFIDDDRSVGRIAEISLRPLGYEVTVASRVDEALCEVRENDRNYDVIVCAANLRDRRREELFAELVRVQPRLPVVIVAGARSDLEDLADDARPLLPEPTQLSRLHEVVTELLGQEPIYDAE